MGYVDGDRRKAPLLTAFRLRTLFVIVTMLAVALAVGIQWFPTLGVLLFWVGILVLSERTSGNRIARRRVVVPAAILTTCAVFSWPEGGKAREPGRVFVCQNNMRQIGSALLTYAVAHGDRLPPAYIADRSGKPMHSWRTLLLRYFDRQVLYAAYRFDEPWDGPNNRKLQADIQILQCPSDPPTAPNSARSSYFVVTGPGTLFPG